MESQKEVLHSLTVLLACGGSCACDPLCRHGFLPSLEQWFWMGQSTDLVSFKKAMRRQSIAMFNTAMQIRKVMCSMPTMLHLQSVHPLMIGNRFCRETPERLSGRITCLSMNTSGGKSSVWFYSKLQ